MRNQKFKNSISKTLKYYKTPFIKYPIYEIFYDNYCEDE